MRHPKVASPDHAVLDVIAERWSPRAFDITRPVSRDAQLRLFEAARWAPSGANAQHWEFIVIKDPEVRKHTIELFKESSAVSKKMELSRPEHLQIGRAHV